MRILIADDDRVSTHLLEATLRSWGYEVVTCSNGRDGLRHLEQPDGPPLAILDWMMPGLDGPEVCRRVRHAQGSGTPRYLILLTARDRPENTVEGQ